MRRLFVLIVAATALSGAAIGVAMADPGLNDVAPHRHFINGREVGPRICDHLGEAGVQAAFNQFHANHHSHNVTGGQGPIAPGLHNEVGAELTAGGCGS
jgi:hypothetical protein